MAKINLKEKIKIPEGVEVVMEPLILRVSGPNGSLERKYYYPGLIVKKEDSSILLEYANASKKEKTVLKTLKAHIKNMLIGAKGDFTYMLKICSGHFPMNVSINGNDLTIKNFLGESVPRKVKLLEGAKVKINGAEIEIVSPDKRVAGQVAGQIEQLCRITNRDKRIFQDGCYIIHKAGKDI